MALTMASMFQLGTHPWLLLGITFASYGVFYLAQWEEYHTGVMFLGYFGVTELHLLTTAMYLASWWFGMLDRQLTRIHRKTTRLEIVAYEARL